MRQKLLRTAMVAAMACMLSLSAQAATTFIYAGGGGGGGGDAAVSDGGSGGSAGEQGYNDVDDGDATNESTAGGKGGAGSGSGSGGGSAAGGVSGGGNTTIGADANGKDSNEISQDGGDGYRGMHPLIGGTHNVTQFTDNDEIQLLGGAGGAGGQSTTFGAGGDGGHGNGVWFDLIGGVSGKATIAADITLKAGKGGDRGTANGSALGGLGGDGGDVYFEVSSDMRELTFDGAAVVLEGGDAGLPGGENNAYSGAGGRADFYTPDATIILDNSSTITLTRGDTATAGSYNTYGGDVALYVGILKAGIGSNSLSTAGGTGSEYDGYIDISIGAVDATEGNLSFNLTGFDTIASDYLSVGNITVGAGKTFGVTGLTNGLGTTNGWRGDLYTIDDVEVNGLNLTDKTINATLTGDGSSSFDLDSDTVITGNSTTKVGSGTKVELNLDADMGQAILDGTYTTIKLFSSGIDGEENVVEGNINISSGLYGGEGSYANGVLSALKLAPLDTGADGMAYNALLSAPAVVLLVNGGGDVAERVTSSFSPLSFRQGSRLSGVQFGAFASMGGGHVEVDAGSGVDSDNFHLLVGPGLRVATGTGTTDMGAFFEAGWGNYDAHNAVYRGEGNTGYYGGGLLLRHETCSGLYGEASLRIGGAKSEYQSRDKATTDFDLASTYYGGHIDLGYIFRTTAVSTVDVFAKGLLTHVGSDSATDKDGYDFAIDSTTSARTHLGAKYSYNFRPDASFFAKAIWEHEFDGETAGRYNNESIRKADTGGSSVIGEIGVDWQAAERVTLNASIYGIVGKRQGVGGNVNIGIGF